MDERQRLALRETLDCLRPLAFALVIVSLALLLAMMPSLGFAICEFAKSELKSPSASSVHCAEFYFNRYQTLIAGLLALFAALVAARPVMKQAKIVGAQAAMDLLDIVDRDAAKIATEKDILGALWSLLAQLQEALRGFTRNDSTKVYVDNAFRSINDVDMDKLDALIARTALDDDERLRRGTLIGRLRLFRVASNESHAAINESNFAHEVLERVLDYHDEELILMIAEIRSTLDTLNREEADLRTRAARLRRAIADLPA